MLAIHHRLLDRLKNVKAITAGTLAFGVGLTAAAAYVGATMVYDNFSYDITDQKASSKVAGASTEAEKKAKNGQSGASGSNNSTSTSSTTLYGQAYGSSTGTSSNSTATTSGSVVGTTPIVGGRGGSTTSPMLTSPTVTSPTSPAVTISPAPTPSPEPIQIVPPTPGDCLCGTVNQTTETIQGTVNSFLP